MKKGMVLLIGAGPGDPGLITVKGLQCLKDCDAVVYDFLASEELLGVTRPDCRRIYVGKRAGHHSMKQPEINRLLVDLAKEGLCVARLKGGDPFVFGRGGEEALALEAEGIPYRLIPGVTSAVAVPECAGIPVTHRAVSRSFHVITGHTEGEEGGLPPEFQQLAKLPGTLVFLMGLRSLPAIVDGLLAAGRPESLPAAVIENGTTPSARTVRGTLLDICGRVEAAGLHTPAIIVVGETAALDFSSREGLPLDGTVVGITGTATFRERLGTLLTSLGARVECAGAMEVVSFADSPAVRAACENLESYGITVFTSANGVRLFFKGLLDSGRDFRALGSMKFAVIGPGTAAELKKYGFRADYMPSVYRTGELAELLVKVAGGVAACTGTAAGTGAATCTGTAAAPPFPRILIARAKGGSPELTKVLAKAGIPFDDVALYDVSGRAARAERIGAGRTGEENTSAEHTGAEYTGAGHTGAERLDYLTFASASGVEAYFEQMGEEALGSMEGLKTVCIGDVTARALKERGRETDLLAKEFTVRGMVEAILDDRER